MELKNISFLSGKSEMNIIAFKENGLIYIDEYKNDSDLINKLLDESGSMEDVDAIYKDLCIEFTEEKWNVYVTKIIGILEESGCNIVWDH